MAAMEVKCALHKGGEPPVNKDEAQTSWKAYTKCPVNHLQAGPHLHGIPSNQSPVTPLQAGPHIHRIALPTASHAVPHLSSVPHPVPVPPQFAPHDPVFTKCPHGTFMQPVQILPYTGAGIRCMVGSGKAGKTYAQLAEEARIAKEKVEAIHSRARGVPGETQRRAKQLLRPCAAADHEDTSFTSVKNILHGHHSDLAKQSEIMAMFSAKLHHYEAALTSALNKLAIFKDHDEGRKHALFQCEARLRDLQDEIEKNNDQQRHVSQLLSNCLKNHECESKLEEKNREIRSLQESLFRSSIEKDKIKSQKDRVDKVLEEMANESRQGAYIHLGAIPALFESTVARVKSATEVFAKIFILAMRKVKRNLATDAYNLLPGVYLSKPIHIVYVFQAYVSNQMFLGFEDANFCLDDAGLEDDRKRRRDCFMQFSHMAAPFDPKEEDPFSKDKNVAFQKFCCSKFMAVVPPWLERALFKDLRNRDQIDKGKEPPNTEIYDKLKDLAASIWLLHRLATSFKPAGTIFRVRRGAEVDLNLMDLVVPKEEEATFTDKVGFMIMPGFEAKATTIKSLVYLEGPKQTLEQLQQLQQQASAAAGAAGPGVANTGGQGASDGIAALRTRRAASPRKRA